VAAKPVRGERTPEAQLRSLNARLEPGLQKLARSFRNALRKRFPTANELAYDYTRFYVIGYSPTENGIESIFALAARPDGVRLYLTNGQKLPDPKKLLHGSGKQTRFIEVESARQLAQPDVKALIAATVGLASIPFPSRRKGSLIIKSPARKGSVRRAK
jgi:hypothetical protein